MIHESHGPDCPCDREGFCDCIHCPIPCVRDHPDIQVAFPAATIPPVVEDEDIIMRVRTREVE